MSAELKEDWVVSPGGAPGRFTVAAVPPDSSGVFKRCWLSVVYAAAALGAVGGLRSGAARVIGGVSRRRDTALCVHQISLDSIY